MKTNEFFQTDLYNCCHLLFLKWIYNFFKIVCILCLIFFFLHMICLFLEFVLAQNGSIRSLNVSNFFTIHKTGYIIHRAGNFMKFIRKKNYHKIIKLQPVIFIKRLGVRKNRRSICRAFNLFIIKSSFLEKLPQRCRLTNFKYQS